MGRSRSLACLNIVACGKKSQDDDEIDAPVEGRIPSDKHRWSFRKRSATHRVLSNTVPPELPPSSIAKESPKSNANDFSEQTNPPVLGKLSVARKADDVFPLSPVALSSKDGGSLDSIENVSNCKSSALESAAVTIQASVMGYLAQRELAKLKNVIKLQAAVRGHLVRRQAVGTLRCVQAIIKMQALVRARRVCSSEESLAIQHKLSVMRKTASGTADNLEKEEPGGKPNNLCTADTLFRSGFARRLLESAERTKPCIVCDPTKPSSGWSWLERWMSLSAKEHPSRTADLLPEQEELAKKINLVSDEVEASDKCIGTHGFDPSSIKDERPEEEAAYSSGTQLEGDDDLITIDANGFNFHTCHAVEMSNESTEATASQEPPKVASEGSNFASSLRNALQSKVDSLSNHSASPDCAASGSTPDASKNEGGSIKDSLNGPVSKEQDTEGKKPVSIPRKSCNPAFAAVQSKFEELSSPLASGRIRAASNHCGGSRLGSVSPPKSDVRPMDVNQTHDMDSCGNRFQKGTSECGTEISISSTLDSPDRFELERGELGHEVGILDNGDSEEQGTPEDEPHPISDALLPSNAVTSLPGAPEDSLIGSVDPAIVTTNVDPSKHMEPDLKIELKFQADKQVDDSSQEGSPTSRTTILESHGTPSSQVSSGAQRSKADSKKSIRKRITSSTSKGSPSSQNHDSLEKNTLEHLAKESKGGRHRNSFGSAKSDNADCEKGNIIPSYMQATQSARAKALTSHSPKSSPDVHDKDGSLKKRHSLPGSNGKQQNSPRMQRSLSQAQPTAKVNSGHSPQEREWRR